MHTTLFIQSCRNASSLARNKMSSIIGEGSMAKVSPWSSSPGKRWSTKRYILAALAGIVAVAAVTSVVSIVLSPGEIRFSITHASNDADPDGDGWVQLNLTLAANNTSHRAGVQYRSVLVYYLQLQDPSATINYFTQANVTSAPSSQPPLSTTNVEVSALLLKADFGKPATSGGRSNATMISVLVVTEVRFKVGPAYSRPYPIRVVCDPVNYFFRGSLNLTTSVHCSDG